MNIATCCRFFSYLAEELDLTYYERLRMGAPPYTRRIVTAVIFYAMYHGHYAAQKICRFAEDSIGAQWILSGMRMPSYKTSRTTIDALFWLKWTAFSFQSHWNL
ncbi:hypothetical protein [Lentibacillus sp. CBA3610]|uniref:hypothetical protein n=1 Tax=Lentibacillus sp. CBA3610 TaxID=2518176 RepID=UPI0015950162|nr:hypothetical protein [Lentibacillus sp. CBA3610]